MSAADRAGPGDARRRVDHQRHRSGRVVRHVGRADPHEPIAPHQRARCAARHPLGEDKIQLSGGEPLVQRAAERDGQIEPDPRVRPGERTQDLRQLGLHQILGHPEADHTLQLRAGEVAAGPLPGVQDRRGEANHCLAIRGERYRVRVALEQPPANLVFQPGDVLAHR